MVNCARVIRPSGEGLAKPGDEKGRLPKGSSADAPGRSKIAHMVEEPICEQCGSRMLLVERHDRTYIASVTESGIAADSNKPLELDLTLWLECLNDDTHRVEESELDIEWS